MINIVIPTYPPHIRYNNRFLESIARFSSFDDIMINLIISKYDVAAYHHMLIPNSNVRLITISDILRAVQGINIDEYKLLHKLKKFNYQSIKKLYGAYFVCQEFEVDNVVVLDSENILVKPCNYARLLDGWIKSKKVLVDQVTGYGIQADINKRVGQILNKDVPFWGAVQSHWIYNKDILNRLFSKVNIWEAMNGSSIFESILYNVFAYNNSDLKYINQRVVLSAHMPGSFFANLKNKQTTVEYPLWGCEYSDDLLEKYIRYLDNTNQDIANVCDADFYSVNRIIGSTDVKQITYMGIP